MRVTIAKAREGKRDILVEPARGAHLPPVYVRGVAKEGLRFLVAQLVSDARAPHEP